MREECLHGRTYRVVVGAEARRTTVTEFGDEIQYCVERIIFRCSDCNREVSELGRRRAYFPTTTELETTK
jgi:hypothetical protein